jgi:transposase-like protein
VSTIRTCTPERIRKAIHQSGDSVRMLAKQYNISPTTVQKWKRRETIEDKRRGPRAIRSSVLTEGEEEIIILFRRQTLLSLDDCLYALQPSIPTLSRSSLYRCFRRHKLNSLSAISNLAPAAKRCANPSLGCFFIGVIPIEAIDGRGELFIGLDRTSKFGYASFLNEVTKSRFVFLGQLISAVPFKVNTVMSYHRAAADEKPHRGISLKPDLSFRAACALHGVEHISIDSLEQRDDTSSQNLDGRPGGSKAAREYRYTCQQIRVMVEQSTSNYNSTRRLKALNGRTPLEYLSKLWHSESELFNCCPIEPTEA